jgi:hypothetical protein
VHAIAIPSTLQLLAHTYTVVFYSQVLLQDSVGPVEGKQLRGLCPAQKRSCSLEGRWKVAFIRSCCFLKVISYWKAVLATITDACCGCCWVSTCRKAPPGEAFKLYGLCGTPGRKLLGKGGSCPPRTYCASEC